MVPDQNGSKLPHERHRPITQWHQGRRGPGRGPRLSVAESGAQAGSAMAGAPFFPQDVRSLHPEGQNLIPRGLKTDPLTIKV